MFSRAANRGALLALVAMAALYPSGAQANWIFDGGAEYRWDGNLSKSEEEPVADSAASVDVAAGRSFTVGDYTGLALTATGRAEAFAAHDRLNNTELGLSLSLKRRFGLGPEAWNLALTLRGGQRSFVDHYRNVQTAGGGVSAARWLSDRLSVRFGLLYEISAALNESPKSSYENIPSDVYDLSATSATASVGYRVGDTGTMTLSLAYRDGDLVSSAKPNKKTMWAAKAITNDEALDGRLAYRIGAQTTSVGIGYTQGALSNGSLSVGGEYRSSNGAGGLNYTGLVLRATFLYSF